jgi:hypothetical protein
MTIVPPPTPSSIHTITSVLISRLPWPKFPWHKPPLTMYNTAVNAVEISPTPTSAHYDYDQPWQYCHLPLDLLHPIYYFIAYYYRLPWPNFSLHKPQNTATVQCNALLVVSRDISSVGAPMQIMYWMGWLLATYALLSDDSHRTNEICKWKERGECKVWCNALKYYHHRHKLIVSSYQSQILCTTLNNGHYKQLLYGGRFVSFLCWDVRCVWCDSDLTTCMLKISWFCLL